MTAKVVNKPPTLSKETLYDTLLKSRTNSALDYSLKAAEATNKFNASEAEKNRQFNAIQAELNRSFQQQSAERSMRFEAEQAKKAQDFSADMSNTQYQRAVADMKAAGLSPLLAYNKMQTSSPSGVMASGSAAAGSTASGSAASGVKADTASALSVEASVLSQFYDLLALSINSGLKLSELKNELTVARVRGLTDTLNAGASVFGNIGRALVAGKSR